MQDKTLEAQSAETADMRKIVVTTIEHHVYKYAVEVPAEFADADYDELHEWLDEGDWPEGFLNDVTLVEIIDVQPA